MINSYLIDEGKATNSLNLSKFLSVDAVLYLQELNFNTESKIINPFKGSHLSNILPNGFRTSF